MRANELSRTSVPSFKLHTKCFTCMFKHKAITVAFTLALIKSGVLWQAPFCGVLPQKKRGRNPTTKLRNQNCIYTERGGESLLSFR